MAQKIDSDIKTIVTVIAIISALIIIMAFVISLYLKSSIQNITKISKRIAGGELSIKISENHKSKDEIGQLYRAISDILARLSGYVEYIREITEVLGVMSDGDMRIQLKNEYVGEFASIKDALNGISSSLNTTLRSIAISSSEVNASAEQVASAAQSLSQGATEQASAIEELGATVTEISSHVEETAENASKVSTLVKKTEDEVANGNQQMKMMVEAMEDINASSAEISKIIKVIDDIAFQTNILALNAAVEAARAGDAGKGFAVVADEVRNLAAKSAAAAKNTTDLIQNSINKVTEGSKIATRTEDSLTIIVQSIEQVSLLVKEITEASMNQASSLNQVTQGIDQISVVVQTNSATAEESAASSEELSGQANTLDNLIAKFKLN